MDATIMVGLPLRTEFVRVKSWHHLQTLVGGHPQVVALRPGTSLAALFVKRKASADDGHWWIYQDEHGEIHRLHLPCVVCRVGLDSRGKLTVSGPTEDDFDWMLEYLFDATVNNEAVDP